jgi:uncharacterized OB-fold protein
MGSSERRLMRCASRCDPEQLKVGMKVKAAFKVRKEHEGNILDIKYFKPLG